MKREERGRTPKGRSGREREGLSHSGADDDGVRFRWNEKQIVFTGGNKSQRVVGNVSARADARECERVSGELSRV